VPREAPEEARQPGGDALVEGPLQMPKAYREDVLTLAAQYPFGVALPRLKESIILILARWSQSNYRDARIMDESSIRHALAAFRADFAIINGIRRLLADATSYANNASSLTGHQVIEAAVAAVAAGHIHALIAVVPTDKASHPPISYSLLAARYLWSPTGTTQDRNAQDAGFFAFLHQQLPGLCCDAYAGMSGSGDQIVQLTDHGYEFLFDLGAERVVAAFGTTQYNPGARDSARMSGFLGQVTNKAELQRMALQGEDGRLDKAKLTWRDRFFQTYRHRYDRGHFISHRQGGGLDINLFPQRADINQGLTPLGAEYRALETACVAKPGVDPVFCCARPIYDDGSWVPAELEYAVIYSPQRMVVRRFPNK
jgi:hypothetical protein